LGICYRQCGSIFGVVRALARSIGWLEFYNDRTQTVAVGPFSISWELSMGEHEKTSALPNTVRNLPGVTKGFVQSGKDDVWREFVMRISTDKIRALGYFALCSAVCFRIVFVPSFADVGMPSGSATLHPFLWALAYSAYSEFRWAILRHSAKRKR